MNGVSYFLLDHSQGCCCQGIQAIIKGQASVEGQASIKVETSI